MRRLCRCRVTMEYLAGKEHTTWELLGEAVPTALMMVAPMVVMVVMVAMVAAGAAGGGRRPSLLMNENAPLLYPFSVRYIRCPHCMIYV